MDTRARSIASAIIGIRVTKRGQQNNTNLHRQDEEIVLTVLSISPLLNVSLPHLPLSLCSSDFDTKSLLGQWVTLLLITWVYLPLQFVSHPSETLQHAFSVPSRITWAVRGN